jgi:hypothetical protein
MRPDKSDFCELFFIMDMRDQSISIVNNLESRPVIFDHLRPREISEDILLVFPLGFLHNIFPCGQAYQFKAPIKNKRKLANYQLKIIYFKA